MPECLFGLIIIIIAVVAVSLLLCDPRALRIASNQVYDPVIFLCVLIDDLLHSGLHFGDEQYYINSFTNLSLNDGRCMAWLNI